MNNFRELFDAWPTPKRVNFAADIGVPVGSVTQFYHRGNLPPGYFKATVEAAERRGIEGVTADLLASLADRRKDAAQ